MYCPHFQLLLGRNEVSHFRHSSPTRNLLYKKRTWEKPWKNLLNQAFYVVVRMSRRRSYLSIYSSRAFWKHCTVLGDLRHLLESSFYFCVDDGVDLDSDVVVSSIIWQRRFAHWPAILICYLSNSSSSLRSSWFSISLFSLKLSPDSTMEFLNAFPLFINDIITSSSPS